MLCARHPDMMLQQERGGDTPLNYSCCSNMSVVQVLCEAGGREAVSAAVQHPTDPRYYLNGWLPLHNFVTSYADTLKKQPLSEAADAFRLLLRLYPEAASIEGGVGDWKTTPYQLAVEHNVPAYYRRLLLQAAPDLDPAELRRAAHGDVCGVRGRVKIAFAPGPATRGKQGPGEARGVVLVIYSIQFFGRERGMCCSFHANNRPQYR